MDVMDNFKSILNVSMTFTLLLLPKRANLMRTIHYITFILFLQFNRIESSSVNDRRILQQGKDNQNVKTIKVIDTSHHRRHYHHRHHYHDDIPYQYNTIASFSTSDGNRITVDSNTYLTINGFVNSNEERICATNLQKSDINNDMKIDSTEFTKFIEYQSDGTITEELYANLQSAFILVFLSTACLTCYEETSDDSCCLGDNANIPIDEYVGQDTNEKYSKTLFAVCVPVIDKINEMNQQEQPTINNPSIPTSPQSITTTAPISPPVLTQVPITSSPVTSSPVTSSPITSSPITSSPITSSPITTSPVSIQPTTTPVQISSVPTSTKPFESTQVPVPPPILVTNQPTTKGPTYSPTRKVTTFYPSHRPSSIPTTIPSSIPTTIPSTRPSSIPSIIPTTIPSSIPTTIPSTIPSTNPSTIPTTNPSTIPTTNPSTIPTTIPSTIPTGSPSQVPTVVPTNAIPSSTPSSNPSILPSSNPQQIIKTNVPSNTPTDNPTQILSSKPTMKPSNIPSSKPSNRPSEIPIQIPSKLPSPVPTQIPSHVPSQVPVQLPTTNPTEIVVPEVDCISFSYMIKGLNYTANEIMLGINNTIRSGLEKATRDLTISIFNTTYPKNTIRLRRDTSRTSISNSIMSENRLVDLRHKSITTDQSSDDFSFTSTYTSMLHETKTNVAFQKAYEQWDMVNRSTSNEQLGLHESRTPASLQLASSPGSTTNPSHQNRNASIPERQLRQRLYSYRYRYNRRLVYYSDVYPVNITRIIDFPMISNTTENAFIVSSDVCYVIEQGDKVTDIQTTLSSQLKEAFLNGNFTNSFPKRKIKIKKSKY